MIHTKKRYWEKFNIKTAMNLQNNQLSNCEPYSNLSLSYSLHFTHATVVIAFTICHSLTLSLQTHNSPLLQILPTIDCRFPPNSLYQLSVLVSCFTVFLHWLCAENSTGYLSFFQHTLDICILYYKGHSIILIFSLHYKRYYTKNGIHIQQSSLLTQLFDTLC